MERQPQIEVIQQIRHQVTGLLIGSDGYIGERDIAFNDGDARRYGYSRVSINAEDDGSYWYYFVRPTTDEVVEDVDRYVVTKHGTLQHERVTANYSGDELAVLKEYDAVVERWTKMIARLGAQGLVDEAGEVKLLNELTGRYKDARSERFRYSNAARLNLVANETDEYEQTVSMLTRVISSHFEVIKHMHRNDFEASSLFERYEQITSDVFRCYIRRCDAEDSASARLLEVSMAARERLELTEADPVCEDEAWDVLKILDACERYLK